jgi:hypothetical protein
MRRIERECKVRLMRREITPEMLVQFAEQAKHEPVIDQHLEHHSPNARAHHKGGPSFNGGSAGAGPKRRSFGPPRRFTQSAGRP